MITKSSGDSGLDSCAVKGIMGQGVKLGWLSENHTRVMYSGSFPDFEGSLVAMSKNVLVCRKYR